ncbi:hypothetical protein FA95DRAFT_1604082 [Auriscalpium vulgare]|uniref:Uncharacterized protein n=1 Tax=Auriscalpium vulgare TaxID=40419 RepID=A0ACB8S194_9AGAM|nr:hypothetical protein FA95DRAFT_1604082 [Auriscalpium vulgare]
MGPTKKEKASGVGATSFLDLKANLAGAEAAIMKAKAAGKTAATGFDRPGKKVSKWALPNKGVSARAARDVEALRVSKPTADAAKESLKKKAKLYEAAKKGDYTALTPAQQEALLVNFEEKPDDAYESDSDDVDESLTVPKPPAEEDPIIEYEDEFGRMRTAPRSKVPTNLLPVKPMKIGDDDGDEGHVLENPRNYFPVYEPSLERVTALREAQAEDDKPLEQHYDASLENRAKGAAFYGLSTDDELRKKQQEDLKAAREETLRRRQETGAVDMKPGEREGMQGGAEIRSFAFEKRKRDREERQKQLEAKRRKVKGIEEPPAPEPSTSTSSNPNPNPPLPSNPNPPLPSPSTVPPPAAASNDPFAALEQQLGQEKPRPKDADAFLAGMQQQFSNGRR